MTVGEGMPQVGVEAPEAAARALHTRGRSGRAVGLLLGFVADAVVPDPRRGHPVAGLGTTAAAVERLVYADSRRRGAVYAASCVSVVLSVGLAVGRIVRGHPRIAVLVAGTAAWTVLGGASLAREAGEMATALRRDDLAVARRRLPYLCGRDPDALDRAGLARATVESVAENTADAVIGPLLWGAVAGLPGMLAYRAVNTLDAMVGHRSARYARFGWAAARLDDAATWLPARLTGLLAVAGAPLVGGSPRESYRIFRRDGCRHPSPNAGRCEAAFAGALGLRLGGVNTYGQHDQRVEHRPQLGDGRAPDPDDITRAVRLSRATGFAATLLAAAAAVGFERLRVRRRRRGGVSLRTSA